MLAQLDLLILLKLCTNGDEPWGHPVWPDPDGNVRGITFEPLSSSVPKAAKHDPALYELLALVDVLREGRARESQRAAKELAVRLQTL